MYNGSEEYVSEWSCPTRCYWRCSIPADYNFLAGRHVFFIECRGLPSPCNDQSSRNSSATSRPDCLTTDWMTDDLTVYDWHGIALHVRRWGRQLSIDRQIHSRGLRFSGRHSLPLVHSSHIRSRLLALDCWFGQCFSCVQEAPYTNPRGDDGYLIELLLWLSSYHPNAWISILLHDGLQLLLLLLLLLLLHNLLTACSMTFK